MTVNQINQVGPVHEGDGVNRTRQAAGPAKDVPSFKETLSSFLNDVNGLQKKADESIQKMAAGEINDVHQVMSSVEEANVAFNMMMEIRNKVLDAYQEVMRIRL
ncbi:MAG: flagellar hook-basal body complex protein FliE [Chitinispirillaceae bacterium]|nr:flagellar hook-basal body complex protein FliE [Chitinispirillaceae bacterium]